MFGVNDGEPRDPSGDENARPSSYISRVHLEVIAILLPIFVVLVAVGWYTLPQSTGFSALPDNMVITLTSPSAVNGFSEVLHRTDDNGAVLDIAAGQLPCRALHGLLESTISKVRVCVRRPCCRRALSPTFQSLVLQNVSHRSTSVTQTRTGTRWSRAPVPCSSSSVGRRTDRHNSMAPTSTRSFRRSMPDPIVGVGS